MWATFVPDLGIYRARCPICTRTFFNVAQVRVERKMDQHIEVEHPREMVGRD